MVALKMLKMLPPIYLSIKEIMSMASKDKKRKDDKSKMKPKKDDKSKKGC